MRTLRYQGFSTQSPGHKRASLYSFSVAGSSLAGEINWAGTRHLQLGAGVISKGTETRVSKPVAVMATIAVALGEC